MTHCLEQLFELEYEEMRDRLAIAIHQFAKRQMTWFRGMERKGLRIHWTRATSDFDDRKDTSGAQI